MKKLILVIGLCLISTASSAEHKCHVSQDAQDMAVRISTVLVRTLACTNSREVGHLIAEVTDAMMPPECRS
jgi:hypothetical protein